MEYAGMRNVKVHLSHCNQGEYIGSCKYGENDTCAALIYNDLMGNKEKTIEYTKGEWKAWLIEKPNRWMVCAGDDGANGIAKMVDINQEANAQLISMAPRMYEACKAIWEAHCMSHLDYGKKELAEISKLDTLIAEVDSKT